jgi:hypothetical protein
MSLLFELDADSTPSAQKIDEFERFEAAALTTRTQTVATLSTISTIIAHSTSPPFSLIDPYTSGLMTIGHAIDSLRLLDIEESNLTVRDLEE